MRRRIGTCSETGKAVYLHEMTTMHGVTEYYLQRSCGLRANYGPPWKWDQVPCFFPKENTAIFFWKNFLQKNNHVIDWKEWF